MVNGANFPINLNADWRQKQAFNSIQFQFSLFV